MNKYQLGTLIYLVGGIAWMYVYAYIIDPEIQAIVTRMTGAHFKEVTDRGWHRTHHYTVIKENVGESGAFKVWALYGLLAIPTIIVWVGLGFDLITLFELYILRV